MNNAITYVTIMAVLCKLIHSYALCLNISLGTKVLQDIMHLKLSWQA